MLITYMWTYCSLREMCTFSHYRHCFMYFDSSCLDTYNPWTALLLRNNCTVLQTAAWDLFCVGKWFMTLSNHSLLSLFSKVYWSEIQEPLGCNIFVFGMLFWSQCWISQYYMWTLDPKKWLRYQGNIASYRGPFSEKKESVKWLFHAHTFTGVKYTLSSLYICFAVVFILKSVQFFIACERSR